MNIWNSKPRKVKCINNKDNKFYNCDENSPLLIVGETYTLKYIEVHSWLTEVWLEEFPGVEFNSSCFEEIEKQIDTNNKIKFILNGCDISFIAEAPADITLEQLLRQCDKIKPDWCACGICSYAKIYEGDNPTEIEIDYDSIRKTSDDVSCRIVGD